MGLHIAFEKILLIGVLLFILASVLVMGKWMPHQSAAIVLLVLLGLYGVFMYLAQAHHRRKIKKGQVPQILHNDYHPSVSIVIPAHNEALVIAETVKNMMALDYDQAELWVLDDRSTDDTARVLAQLSEAYPGRFHYVVRPPDSVPGKSAVLNDALRCTHGDVVVVFDADARVAPDFLTRALPYLADSTVGAIQVRKVIMNRTANLLTRCQHHEYLIDAHYQEGRDIIKGAVELRGNGQLVKREALDSVDGWTEDTITDDLDLSTKLHLVGWDIRFVTATTVEEEGILKFRPLLRQRRRWAEGSLKRYLEYGVDMFVSPDISRKVQVDMVAYLLKFLFPLWMVADGFVQTINWLMGDWPQHLMSSMVVLPLFAFFVLSAAITAIGHFERPGFLKTLWWSVETAAFMTLIWVPVVIGITVRILVRPDNAPLNWGKTEHLGTQAMVKPSKMVRFRNLIRRVGELSLGRLEN